MSRHQSGPVVCISYVAAANLWTVARFPIANQGAEILAVEQSIAADAPMAAAVLASLGAPSLLLANPIGTDSRGAEVRRWLERHQVAATVAIKDGLDTPQIVVVADHARTRTWFPHLPGVIDALEHIDLAPLADASFAYIDCYQLIEAPAIRAILAARLAGIPLLLNLGGSPMSASVVAAVRGYPELIIQTNVDDDSAAEAPRIASLILEDTRAEWVVITAGAGGAFALSRIERLSVPAFRAEVHHTHCAGAAFSGGLIYGLLQDLPIGDSLELACASGALRCERGHHEPMPTLAELRGCISSRERFITPAA
jgi:sugar/nucleoside kinase (ribokinase family)